ncbi:hypothetical protein FACS1894166_09880 [Bacilli bacterium]|nr:hypothetical protein FACS1894166_09880 [Bacilli bacterium]
MIKSAAFLGCELLTEVEIKSGSLDCETEGFENCLKLNKVDFEKINIRLSLKQASNLFAGTGFTNITIPNS